MMLNNYSILYMHQVKNGTSIDTFNVMFKNTNNETNGYKTFKTLFFFTTINKTTFERIDKEIE